MIAFVLVSHSRDVASGVREMARQMTGDVVPVVACGGMPDGSLGTDACAIAAAIRGLRENDGVIVLCDLGSAILSAEQALDFLGENERCNVRIADAPFLEGALLGAIQSSAGSPMDEVFRTAEGARELRKL
jgi:dihydroxyacetone kinase phosphotransfer subunit